MFKKKECEKCRKKISKKYEFCPYCGSQFNENPENWGILGENDDLNEFEQFSNSIFGKISGSMINKMLGGAMRMLEKEMQKEIKNQNFKPKTNIRLMINGREINLNNQETENNKKRQEIKEMPLNTLPHEKLKKISSLPKQEPATKIRRLSDKVIYEIQMPEVKSVKDISIIKLENSIEIKALAEDKAYFKLIPINLPILNYELSKGKLVLELSVKN